MNILLIEDNELVARAFHRALTKHGHVVTHVIGIGAALDVLTDMKEGEGTTPDLIITDRDVVGGDAWAFVREAEQQGYVQEERIIFMSGRLPDEAPPERFFFKGLDSVSRLLEMIEEVGR